ncbi:MAG: transcription termination factor NusA [bacterium]
MDKSFLEAIREIQQEKNISEEVIVNALNTALEKAFRQDYNIPEEYDLEVDMDLSEFELDVLGEKEVVRSPFNPSCQVKLEEAEKYNEDVSYGERVYIPLDTDALSRSSMQMIKSVLQQKIQHAEEEKYYNKYEEKLLELVNGVVQQVKEKAVYIQLEEQVEAILPYREQIKSDDYSPGNRMKFLVVKVSLQEDGLLVVVSRTHPALISRLFKLHIPEVHDGLIDIVNVAREAGSRSKVAVKTNDPTLDPIGTCVGPQGSRIQSIVDEVNGEKIDIIPHEKDEKKFIKNSLSPAEITRVKLVEDEQLAQVVVPEDQLSLAIGKGGQNARLTAKLCGWSIDIYSEKEFASLRSEEALEVAASIFKDSGKESDFLTDLDGVGPAMADKLKEAGLDSTTAIVEAGPEGLKEVDGIGEAKAESIHTQVAQLVKSAVAEGEEGEPSREETAEEIKESVFGPAKTVEIEEEEQQEQKLTQTPFKED